MTCTNCKYNENTVFPQPKVRELLDKFERVQLYTDGVPAELYATDPGERARKAEGRANRKFKIDAFGTDQLPLYAILLPTAGRQGEGARRLRRGEDQPARPVRRWLKEGLEKASR